MKLKNKLLAKRILSFILPMTLLISGFSVPVHAEDKLPKESSVDNKVVSDTNYIDENANNASSPVKPPQDASKIIKIKSVEDFKTIDYSDADAYYVLENDIELGKHYYPEKANFKATLDGRGHTINFGEIRPANYLFESVEAGAVVQNVKFVGKVGNTNHHVGYPNGPLGRTIRGSIINCVTEVDGDIASGFAQTLDGGIISNSISMIQGNGKAIIDKYKSGNIKNVYWETGLNSSEIPQDAMIDSGEKTEEELKSDEFIELLNSNKGEYGSEWIKGENGYPTLKANTPDINENTVDKSPLENEIKKAEELNEKQYSKETWDELQKTLESARELLKNPNVTSEQITAEVEKIEEAIKALEKVPYVYFKYDDGRIQQMDENDTFTLSALDAGNFILEGTDKTADWDCVSEIGYVNKHYWISGSSGRYMPYNVAKVDATVRDKNNPNEVLKTFHINNVSTNVEELKLFVGDQEVSMDKPYQAQGSQNATVTVKGKVKGKEELVTIPASAALEFDKESGSGTIDFSGNFQISNNKEAVFTVKLIENETIAKFKVTPNNIPLKNFKVTAPEEWYIHEWNGLGGYYVGIMNGPNPDKNFQVKFEPENASNKKLLWKALTPDIAEYMEAFDNGIIPKKAGIARFEVSSIDNPELKQEVSVEFKYKYPLKTATVEEDTFELEQGEFLDININTDPKDASEQRFKWSYSKDGIVKVGDTVNTDPGNVLTPKKTLHTLTALEPGVVTVTGVPFDETAGCKPVQFKVRVSKDGVVPEPEEPTYLSLAKKDIRHGLDALKKYKQEAYGNEWNIFTILRAGDKVSQENLDKYYESVKKKVTEESSDMSSTDFARVIITLEAMGKDPSNVGGVNLLEKLYNSEKLYNEGSNNHIWALIALDGWKSEIPSDAKWTREKLIEKIISFQNEQGGFGLSYSKDSSIDMTAMALQSLAPYYNNDKYPEVKKVVDKSLGYLKSQKTMDAGYMDAGVENSCTTAQVLTALAALNIDPVKAENGFTSNNNNIITNLDGYKIESGFAWRKSENINGMANQQVTYALVAYERMMEGRNGLYDMTDTKPEKPSVTPDQEKANEVIEAIEGIGEVTLESKDKIAAVREAYEGLTEAQKKLVTNYDKLVKAEEELKKLEDAEAQQQLDKEKANKVIEAIEGIGEVTLESKDEIAAAREAYEGLTEAQKNLVTNYDKLVKAEEELKKLEDAEAQKQLDQEKANEVIEAIEGIGEVTLESKDKIAAAREAYEGLTEAQKNLVTNYDKLVKAEEELNKLEDAEAQQQGNNNNNNDNNNSNSNNNSNNNNNKDENNAESNNNSNPIVKTGDESQIGMLSVLVIMSMLGVVIVERKKRSI